ncbi:MAG: mucoidy inhibitor MuiA family protein [Deltaproteobacteria bacterium]|nr:mucoidy inhibitor MuiA family protein [Deltaproteobacteria bacterium]
MSRPACRLLAAILVPGLLSLSAAPASSGPVPSRVDRVVLYPDLAEVTRIAEAGEGAGSVTLSGLTPNLLPESVSVKVLEGGLAIAGVTVEDVFRTEPSDARVRELERTIEDLSAGKRLAEETSKGFAREKELLEQGVLAVYRTGGDPARADQAAKGSAPVPRLTPAEIEASLSLYRDRSRAIDEKVSEKEQAIRDLDRKIAAARQELDKLRNPRPTQEKAVRIDLVRPAGGRLAVTYLVPAAGFIPRYDARLSPERGTLALELLGEAWQRTGEEWKDVALSFSTARPGRMAQLPPLPPWEIDFYRPPVILDQKSMMMMGEMAPRAAVRREAPEAKAEGLPAPERKFASFAVTLEGRHSLPGNGEKKSFRLAEREQKVKVAWRSIPRVTDGAFVAAEGVNGTGLAVLAAPAGLFLDGAYVGKGRLPDIPEGGEIRVEFGKDDAVPVERKEILRTKEEGGLFGKVKRVRYRYEITARNFRKEPVPLTVLDRIPVSRHKDIVVKDVEITGGGKQWEPGGWKDGSPGEVKWEFPLAPGEKKALGLSFTVEYPADREIQGL